LFNAQCSLSNFIGDSELIIIIIFIFTKFGSMFLTYYVSVYFLILSFSKSKISMRSWWGHWKKGEKGEKESKWESSGSKLKWETVGNMRTEEYHKIGVKLGVSWIHLLRFESLRVRLQFVKFVMFFYWKFSKDLRSA